MTYIFFDVGAHNGGDSLPLVYRNIDVVVYAFEPTPELINQLKISSTQFQNYNIIPKAVSNYNGKATFNVAGQGDWGCGSLNKFYDSSVLEKTWPGRSDFKITTSIEVEVITLKKFIEENNIKKIDYLHIDAQGQDLEVLMGLEEYIDIVRSGVVEMPSSHTNKLYETQKYIVDDAIDFLRKHNFIITDIKANDPQGNEINIFFSKNYP